eukprot:NODE_5363_length_1778_cov_10.760751.p1 GENE.NODE_5363_length_1778_cov_10.760751~~NODE_5363_length_1778_cov_10.760751.p1  ORF type:complete len:517 (-),score=85.59 NODE_5363_length_1778_cov_10.760751:117-1667(-)
MAEGFDNTSTVLSWKLSDEPLWADAAIVFWRVLLYFDEPSEAIAWAICLGSALALIYFVAKRCPRACFACIVSWLAWLTWQDLFVPGSGALEDAQLRLGDALGATSVLARALVNAVVIWTAVFLPFLQDVIVSGCDVFSRIPAEYRLYFVSVALAIYGIRGSYHMLHSQQAFVTKFFFHAGFLVGGPALWVLTGFLSHQWSSFLLRHVITTVPVFASLAVVAKAPNISSGSHDQGSGLLRRRSMSLLPAPPRSNAEMHRLWLSYWACWPMARLLEATVEGVPQIVPHVDSVAITAKLQRITLTFIIWLQVWQGSRLLNYTAWRAMPKTNIPDRIAKWLKKQGLIVTEKIMSVRAAPSASHWSLVWLPWLAQALRLDVTGIWPRVLGLLLAVLATLVVSMWLFFRAWRALSRVSTLMLWLLASMDAADVVMNGDEVVYSQKLAFWVLARGWSMLTLLPYVGPVFGFVTPFVFTMLLLTSEKVMRWLVLPLLGRFRSTTVAQLQQLASPRKALETHSE